MGDKNNLGKSYDGTLHTPSVRTILHLSSDEDTSKVLEEWLSTVSLQ